MMMTGSQARSLGWMAVLATCLALVTVLSLNVHALKSEVLLAERQIIALKRETLLLETEFEARASQRQLAEWNAVEFGFAPPRADQFLGSERQLASLGVPLGPNAPAPIRLARAETADRIAERAGPMVSPVSGEPVTLAAAAREDDAGTVFTEAFGDFLVEASPIRAAHAETRRERGAILAATGAAAAGGE